MMEYLPTQIQGHSLSQWKVLGPNQVPYDVLRF